MSKHVVIIGNGIAGITAARFIRKRSDFAITVISAESDHFYARTALMYVYMGHLRYRDTKPYEDDFWAKNRIALVRDYAEWVDPDRKAVHLRSGRILGYDVLLLATGSVWNTFGWPGEDLEGVQGLYGLQDLERMERNTRGIHRAVVVGGGLIGIEMAEMLHTRHIPVTFLVREERYMSHLFPPEESALIHDEIVGHGVDLRLGTELQAILPDGRGRARAVVTSDGEEIPCGFVGLTVGVRPNVEVAVRSGIETRRGILVNAFFETSAPDVYAAGDCAEFRDPETGHRAVEQLWYTGRNHGKTVARTICGERTAYRKGIFFNSAKFFTVEYQTYGQVDPVPEEEATSLLWQDPEGPRLVRIQYEREGGRVTGFNLFNVRYRQEVCERWIREGRSIGYVVDHLAEAAFDPEFARRHERAVASIFRGEAGGGGPARGRRRGLLARLFG